MMKLNPAWGGRRGALFPYVTLPQEKKGGSTIIPSFLQIKLISSSALLKKEILQSGTSYPVSSPHDPLLFTGAQLLCCCCQSRGPSP